MKKFSGKFSQMCPIFCSLWLQYCIIFGHVHTSMQFFELQEKFIHISVWTSHLGQLSLPSLWFR